MSEDTKPKDEKIPDAQPKEEDIPDTKPEKKRKEPLSRADYHNVIVAYVAIVLSVISLFVDVIQAFPRENIQILGAMDDGYYHFDGEKLFKNFQVTVANNSTIPVSVVKITIKRDGEAKTFEISDLPDVLPLNMETNHTEVVTIPWEIFLSSSSKSWLDRRYTNSESELLFPSGDNLKERAETFFEGNSDAVAYYEALYGQRKISLSITLYTAKKNRYSLATEDMGKPISADSEGDWVSNPFHFGVTR